MPSNLQLVRPPLSMRDRLIVALDLDDLVGAKAAIERLAGEVAQIVLENVTKAYGTDRALVGTCRLIEVCWISRLLAD